LTCVLFLLSILPGEMYPMNIKAFGEKYGHAIHGIGAYAMTCCFGWEKTAFFWVGIECAQILAYDIQRRELDTVLDLTFDLTGILLGEGTRDLLKKSKPYDERALRRDMEYWQWRLKILKEMERDQEKRLELERLQKKNPDDRKI